MELFSKAERIQSLRTEQDWTVRQGYAQESSFPFPDLYLSDQAAELGRKDPAFLPFLRECIETFVCHDYGHLSSLDQVENFLSRDVRKEYTWMRGNYPSDAWGEVQLDIFYDMGLFHLNGTAPRDIALAQAKKEREIKEMTP